MGFGRPVYLAKLQVLSVFLLSAFCMSAAANYTTHDEAKKFIDELVEKHQFNRSELEGIFSQAEQKESILKAISRPAEKRLEWKDYRKIFVTEGRIKKGREFVVQYADLLAQAEDKYGVSRYVIAAIIGVETYYGKNKGSYRVVDALSTLAFDYPPRSRFFRTELEHFLLMTREQHFDVLKVKGSYAGAMGYGQFIPSSYRAYAVDFDDDGVSDILDNPADAIGSVANYFRRHGWARGESVVDPAVHSGASEEVFYKSLKPKHTVQQLAELGVKASPATELNPESKARLLSLEGAEGEELWLTYQNFYVITRYNHSPLYAMAVYQLSEAIKR